MTLTGSIDPRRLGASANVSCLVGAAVALSLALPASPVSQVVGVAGLLVLTGATVSSLLALDVSLSHRICVCAATGFLVVTCLGAAAGWTLPHLGVADPLHRTPLVVLWLAVDALLVATSIRRRRDPVREVLRGLTARDVGWTLLLGLPIALSIYGAVQLNDGGSSAPAVFAAVVAVALALGAVCIPDRVGRPPRVLLLLSAFLTCALQGPLRGGWLAGVDIQHEYYVGHLAITQGVFPLQHYSNPYGGMLSLTVFPAELHALFGISLRAILAIVPSLFLGLALLATWATVRERLSPRASALLCTVFVLGCEPLVRQLPQVTRQCYALFFFALLVMAVTSTRLAVRTARILVCVGALGIAVTHYTSAYFAALAVLVGCALTYLVRVDRTRRVLTLPVTAASVGVVAVWDAVVAKSQSNITQLVSAIRHDGLRLLPGKGSVWSRFFHGSTGVVGSVLNGPVLGRVSAVTRAAPAPTHSKYSFMIVIASAKRAPFVSIHTPTTTGARIVGPLLYDLGSALTEAVLVVAVLAVLVCLWRCRRDRLLAGIAGMGLCFLGISALSRVSGTISVDFGPSRVQAQAYLLFAVVAAIVIESVDWSSIMAGRLLTSRWRPLLATVGAGVAALSVTTSSELSNLADPGAQPPAELAANGQQAERLLTPDDMLAAGWAAAHRSSRSILQSDLYGQNALDAFGFSTRRNFFPVVDPVIVDNRSWVFADRTNLVDRTAFQSTGGTGITAYGFPEQFFASTRSVMYISSTDVVFGQVPHDNWGVTDHRTERRR